MLPFDYLHSAAFCLSVPRFTTHHPAGAIHVCAWFWATVDIHRHLFIRYLCWLVAGMLPATNVVSSDAFQWSVRPQHLHVS